MGGLVSMLNNENQGLNMLLSQIVVLIIAIIAKNNVFLGVSYMTSLILYH